MCYRLAQELQTLRESHEELEFAKLQGLSADANPGRTLMYTQRFQLIFYLSPVEWYTLRGVNVCLSWTSLLFFGVWPPIFFSWTYVVEFVNRIKNKYMYMMKFIPMVAILQDLLTLPIIQCQHCKVYLQQTSYSTQVVDLIQYWCISLTIECRSKCTCTAVS